MESGGFPWGQSLKKAGRPSWESVGNQSSPQPACSVVLGSCIKDLRVLGQEGEEWEAPQRKAGTVTVFMVFMSYFRSSQTWESCPWVMKRKPYGHSFPTWGVWGLWDPNSKGGLQGGPPSFWRMGHCS